MKSRAIHVSYRTLCTAVACLLTLSLEQTGVSQAVPQAQNSNSIEKCPTVSVSCPSNFGDENTLTFTASVDRVVPETIRYDWTVSAGTIVEGQGTPTIQVDIRGTTEQAVTATLDVVGLMNLCKHRASCSTMLYEHLPIARLFDKYYPKSIGAAAPKKTRRRRKIRRLH